MGRRVRIRLTAPPRTPSTSLPLQGAAHMRRLSASVTVPIRNRCNAKPVFAGSLCASLTGRLRADRHRSGLPVLGKNRKKHKNRSPKQATQAIEPQSGLEKPAQFPAFSHTKRLSLLFAITRYLIDHIRAFNRP